MFQGAPRCYVKIDVYPSHTNGSHCTASYRLFRAMEVAAERKRQEREAERRLREMQQLLESLLKVVRNIQEASSGPVLGAASSQGDQKVKLIRLSKADDGRETQIYVLWHASVKHILNEECQRSLPSRHQSTKETGNRRCFMFVSSECWSPWSLSLERLRSLGRATTKTSILQSRSRVDQHVMQKLF